MVKNANESMKYIFELQRKIGHNADKGGKFLKKLCCDEGLTLETSASESLYGDQFTLSTQLINHTQPTIS